MTISLLSREMPIAAANGYFGNSHSKNVFSLKENYLLANEESLFFEDYEKDIPKPLFAESFSIPEEYSLNANRNFNLFNLEPFPLTDTIFLTEPLEKIEELKMSYSAIKEIVAIILECKKLYENYGELQREVISNILDKILKKIEIFKDQLCDFKIYNLGCSILQIKEGIELEKKLIDENLSALYLENSSRFSEYNKLAYFRLNQLNEDFFEKQKKVQKKQKFWTQTKHIDGVQMLIVLLYKGVNNSLISKEEANQSFGFVRDFIKSMNVLKLDI